MKFSLNKEDIKALKGLFETSSWNIDMSEFLNEELLCFQPLTKGPIAQFLKNMPLGESKTLPYELAGYEEEGAKEHLPKITHCDPALFQSDPLYGVYLGLAYQEGDFRLGLRRVEAYEPFLLEETRSDKSTGFVEINSIGYFSEAFPYPALEENGTVWMSLLPHEINTMKGAIERMSGNILVHGLGMGYVPAMLALKADVSSITVIEKDPRVIDIFEKAIRKNLQNEDKIRVICADSLTFEEDRDYDYRFVDLYHSEEDGIIPYIAFLKKNKPNTVFWIEQSLLCYIRRILIELMSEELEGFYYPEEEGEIGALFSGIKKALADHEIKGYHSVEELLSEEGLRKVLRK